MSRGYFEDISEIRKNGGKVYAMNNVVFSVLFDCLLLLRLDDR
jgi:hypothetical protein